MKVETRSMLIGNELTSISGSPQNSVPLNFISSGMPLLGLHNLYWSLKVETHKQARSIRDCLTE